MRVEFFNTHPEGERYTQEAVDHWIGKEVPLTQEGRYLGMVKILNVTVTDEGIWFLYETNADLKLSIELPAPGEYSIGNGDAP